MRFKDYQTCMRCGKKFKNLRKYKDKLVCYRCWLELKREEKKKKNGKKD